MLCIRKLVLESGLSSVSPRNHDISGLGELTSWHSKINRFPSSSCLSCGFWVKLGAKSSATPMALGRLRTPLYRESHGWRATLFPSKSRAPLAAFFPLLLEGILANSWIGSNGADSRHHPTYRCSSSLTRTTTNPPLRSILVKPGSLLLAL